ncbi:MAG: ankyrin repeat domain-containing protein [Candidatus Micrarchaeota archaeon]|nr:ankyrin repeat domain-containing protein [Candidatus Micrarchaeota archaeon]
MKLSPVNAFKNVVRLSKTHIFRRFFYRSKNGDILPSYNAKATRELLDAVKNNDLDAVKNALSNGANPNAQDLNSEDGNFVLHIALQKGNNDILLELLCHQRILVDVPNDKEVTPLMMAIDNRDVETLILLKNKIRLLNESLTHEYEKMAHTMLTMAEMYHLLDYSTNFSFVHESLLEQEYRLLLKSNNVSNQVKALVLKQRPSLILKTSEKINHQDLMILEKILKDKKVKTQTKKELITKLLKVAYFEKLGNFFQLARFLFEQVVFDTKIRDMIAADFLYLAFHHEDDNLINYLLRIIHINTLNSNGSTVLLKALYQQDLKVLYKLAERYDVDYDVIDTLGNKASDLIHYSNLPNELKRKLLQRSEHLRRMFKRSL